MKAFTSAAIISILAFSGTSLAAPKQQSDEFNIFNMFGHGQCHNGQGSFVKSECDKMCLIPEQGQQQQRRVVASANMPKATPGVCNGVPVQVQKPITMTYETKVPGPSGKPSNKKVTTVISSAAGAQPTFFLCSECKEAQRQNQPQQKRTPPTPPA